MKTKSKLAAGLASIALMAGGSLVLQAPDANAVLFSGKTTVWINMNGKEVKTTCDPDLLAHGQPQVTLGLIFTRSRGGINETVGLTITSNLVASPRGGTCFWS